MSRFGDNGNNCPHGGYWRVCGSCQEVAAAGPIVIPTVTRAAANPRLTGHLPHDVETAQQKVLKVRGGLLLLEGLAAKRGDESTAVACRHLWRDLEEVRDVLKAVATNGEGGK